MTWRYGKQWELQGRARPSGQAVHGELGLIGAVLQQALVDTKSANTDLRNEALWFLHDEGAIRFWCDLGGIDPATFHERVRQALGPG